MARWTFVRHGESTANAGGTIAGHTDVPLTPRGEAQARALTERLGRCRFDRVLVSDLQRARRTLALALPQAEPQVLVGLRERTLGDWETRSRDEVRAHGGFDTLLAWNGRPPGGESLDDLRQRVLTTLAEHEDGVDTLVVCHGGVMRVVLGALDDLGAAEAARLRYANCAVEERDVPIGTWARLLT